MALMMRLLQRLAQAAEPLVPRSNIGLLVDAQGSSLLGSGPAVGSAVLVRGSAEQPSSEDVENLPVLLGRTRFAAVAPQQLQLRGDEGQEEDAAARPLPALLGRTHVAGILRSRGRGSGGGRMSQAPPPEAQAPETPLPVLLGRRIVNGPPRTRPGPPSAASMQAAARNVRDNFIAMRTHLLQRRAAFRV